ncbi:MAG: hypothetical protein ACTHJR_02870, partial [Sphingomonas sp.]
MILAVATLALVGNRPTVAPSTAPERGPYYATVAPMDETVEHRIMPQVDALLDRLLRERRAMELGGVRVFDSGDKFLPGKIAAMMAYRVLELKPGDPRLAERLTEFADIADLTVDDPNDSWGIYYYTSALHQ